MLFYLLEITSKINRFSFKSGNIVQVYWHYILTLPYKWIYWRVEYLVNRSIIVVGVTLIWRKAVAVIHINSYKTILALFNFGG